VSVHGSALERGVTASPVCTDCHGEHLIRGPRDAESPVAAAGVTATCSHCHEAIGIRETFGLPAGRLSTYEDSYHGLAARGGSPVAANCASCHGYHRILPSNDPASATNQRNLPHTCGRCHPGAGDRFARGAVHVAMATPNRPILGAVRFVYLWLIALTIGGMVLHNLLDFLFKIRRRLHEHLGLVVHAAGHAAASAEEAVAEGGRWFVRMTTSERVQHGLLAASFSILVFTGFALKFPETWIFAWLARLEGGYAWRSLVHRGAALVMVTGALYHVVYLLSARGRRFVLDMLPTIQDARQAGQNLAYWLGLARTPPAFERFGYIEKAEYWALIWGTAVMTVTGGLLWFENQSLQVVDKWVLDLATLVHYYEAWLAFLAIVVWHLYQNVANPDVYPMNWSWITGRIGEEQLRHEHRAEWEGIVAAEEAARLEDEAEPT
jgi:cytochrome b subunit of formate dehydrogenase